MPDLTNAVLVQFVITHPDGKLPTKGYPTDSCYDIYAAEDVKLYPYGKCTVETGLQVGFISEGYGLAIKPRSGLGFKHGIYPHPGEIDCNYRGSLGILLYNTSDIAHQINKGDRIAQFKIERVYPTIVTEIAQPVESDRGAQGFGSTGK